MPVDTTKDLLGQAGVWLGGGGILAGLGVLLRGLITGSLGQEKELRGDLAAEVKRLAADLSAARDEIDELRRDVRQMNRMYLHQYTTREKARGMVNALEKLAGMPETQWPIDPPETFSPPAGGPP